MTLRIVFATALFLMATVSASAQWLPRDAEGWSVFEPGQDSRIIYVSSSSGSNSNSGLSETSPKRTLAAGFALLRDGHPDWLLLRRGDTWEEAFPFWNRSGRSPSQRMVVAAYGTGPRPRLHTGNSSAVFISPGHGAFVRNLIFADLHINPHTSTGISGPTGFRFLTNVRDVLIENCYVENYAVNMAFQAWHDDTRPANIAVRRSIIVDALARDGAHAQGIYAQGVDGLLMEENLLDMNGWSPSIPTANIFRHNVYIQAHQNGDGRGCTDVIFRGNITARASSTGNMQRPGGIIEDNLFLRNPIGLAVGYQESEPAVGVVRNNVVLEAQDITPTVQRGWGIHLTHPHGVRVENNIIAHMRHSTGNIQGLAVGGSYRDVSMLGNIVYAWNVSGETGGRALNWSGAAHGINTVRGNDFQQLSGGHLVRHITPLSPAFTYADNRYFTTNTGSSQFGGMTYSQWIAQSGETGSAWGMASYPHPERDLAAYMAALGRPASLDVFLDEARQQSRSNWRPEFTAAAVNQWIREGFGMPASCYANCDGSTAEPVLTVDDFTCFINRFAEASTLPHAQQTAHYANCDGSTVAPVLTVDDFTCFINAFAHGCP